MLIKIYRGLFNKPKKGTIQKDFEWEDVKKSAKKQFKWLRDKGLTIPVMSI